MKTHLTFLLILVALRCIGATSDQAPPVFVAPTPSPPASTPAATPASPPAGAPASAQATAPAPPPSASAKLPTSELEKLVMPIALHPDSLISVILPASVYPLEIVKAARFVRDTNNIPKVDEQPWDENVKAVAKFPDLIAKMDADLDWTTKLGQAFLDQPKEIMDTIQELRGKAQKAGTLRSTEQQIVTVTNVIVLETNYTQVTTVTNTIVQVAPANPQVVYVPSYPPTVYYPPPAYVYNPVAPLVTFGVGMMWGAAIANNHCDWHGGGVYNDVDIDVDRTVNRGDREVNRGDRTVNRGNSTAQASNRSGNAGARTSQQKWQPDQSRLRSSGAPSAASREARGWGGSSSGRPSASTGMSGTRPSTGNAGARPSTGNAAARPSTGGQTANRSPSTANRQASSSRQSSPSSYNRSSSGSNRSAFSGMSSGASSRNFSSRGASSRGGGFSGGGRGGGGRGGGRR